MSLSSQLDMAQDAWPKAQSYETPPLRGRTAFLKHHIVEQRRFSLTTSCSHTNLRLTKRLKDASVRGPRTASSKPLSCPFRAKRLLRLRSRAAPTGAARKPRGGSRAAALASCRGRRAPTRSPRSRPSGAPRAAPAAPRAAPPR